MKSLWLEEENFDVSPICECKSKIRRIVSPFNEVLTVQMFRRNNRYTTIPFFHIILYC